MATQERRPGGVGGKCSSPSLLPLSRLGCEGAGPALNGRAHVSLAAPFRPLQSASLGCQDGGAAPEPNLQVGSQSSSPASGPESESESSPWGVPDGQEPLPDSLGTPLPLLPGEKTSLGLCPSSALRAGQLAGCHSVTFTSLAGSEPKGPEVAQHLLWPTPILAPLQGAASGCPPCWRWLEGGTT